MTISNLVEKETGARQDGELLDAATSQLLIKLRNSFIVLAPVSRFQWRSHDVLKWPTLMPPQNALCPELF